MHVHTSDTVLSFHNLVEQLELAFSPVIYSENLSATQTVWPAQGLIVGHQWAWEGISASWHLARWL